jgi:streptogrisin C
MRRRFTVVAIGSLLMVTILSTGPSAGAARNLRQEPRVADPAVLDLAKDRGVSLQEAYRRMGWQRRAHVLDQDLRVALGSRYGGLWIGRTDDRIKVGLVGAATDLRSYTVRRGLAEATDTVPVRYSAAYLAAASDWLGAQVVRVNRGAAWPMGSGLLLDDRNVVELLAPSAERMTAAQRALVDAAERRYGGALQLSPSDWPIVGAACDWPYCDAPLRAGVKINNSGSSCTSGFVAKSKVDSTMYLITAGHCIFVGGADDWTSLQPRTGQQHVIGPAWNNKWDSTGDMAILRINNPSSTGWNPKPWVFVTDCSVGNCVEDQDYYISDDGGQGLGERICNAGTHSGTRCGTVTGLNLTRAYPAGGITVTVEHLGGVDICGDKGDSGGPMFDGHVAYGIFVAARPWPNCASFYQGVSAIERDMNVNIVHGTS